MLSPETIALLRAHNVKDQEEAKRRVLDPRGLKRRQAEGLKRKAGKTSWNAGTGGFKIG